eukprot:scaffold4837_cov63-Cyclotella_meneghiniana.AAC.1
MNATNIYKRKTPPLSNGDAKNTTDAPLNNNANNSISNNGASFKNSSSSPTTLQINNISVHFPFTPYDVQTKYMKSVLDALRGGQHALLESPTGTGKTLCLLCSTLAWQQAQKGLLASSKTTADADTNDNDNGGGSSANKTPVIIYASRTHSQLSQVVREMKNTRYRPRQLSVKVFFTGRIHYSLSLTFSLSLFISAVLGSREHMCIHPKVNPQASSSSSSSSSSSNKNKPPPTSTDVNHSCNKLNKDRKCIYRNTLEEHGPNYHPPCSERKAGDENTQPIRDLEDLVSAGKQQRICPFYYTRGLLSQAEIIFVPYNYLFDRDARE